MFGLKRNHGIHNEELYERLSQIPLTLNGNKQTANLGGHTLRREGPDKKICALRTRGTNGQKKGWKTKGGGGDDDDDDDDNDDDDDDDDD